MHLSRARRRGSPGARWLWTHKRDHRRSSAFPRAPEQSVTPIPHAREPMRFEGAMVERRARCRPQSSGIPAGARAAPQGPKWSRVGGSLLSRAGRVREPKNDFRQTRRNTPTEDHSRVSGDDATRFGRRFVRNGPRSQSSECARSLRVAQRRARIVIDRSGISRPRLRPADRLNGSGASSCPAWPRVFAAGS